ncbi:signal peptidase I [Fervidibacter sacchari]
MNEEMQPVPQESWLTKKRGVRDVWFWVFLVLLLVFGFEVWLLFKFMFVATMIGSSSMEPTLEKGDAVIVRRIRFTPDNLPNRGDLVFFRDPITKKDWLVKRVIGLPGETLIIWAGRVYINGVPLDEPYVNGIVEEYGMWQIPKDAVFVMGDNRPSSNDSRDFGPVPLDLIEGKVVFRYFPLGRVGRITP